MMIQRIIDEDFFNTKNPEMYMMDTILYKEIPDNTVLRIGQASRVEVLIPAKMSIDENIADLMEIVMPYFSKYPFMDVDRLVCLYGKIDGVWTSIPLVSTLDTELAFICTPISKKIQLKIPAETTITELAVYYIPAGAMFELDHIVNAPTGKYEVLIAREHFAKLIESDIRQNVIRSGKGAEITTGQVLAIKVVGTNQDLQFDVQHPSGTGLVPITFVNIDTQMQ